MYTHQKTKKSKKWQDGKLRVSNNGKVVLLNDSGNQLETVYVKADQVIVTVGQNKTFKVLQHLPKHMHAKKIVTCQNS